MDLQNFFRNLNDSYPYLSLGTAAAGLITGFLLGNYFSGTKPDETEYTDTTQKFKNVDEKYKLRSVSGAMTSEESSSVDVLIESWYKVFDGFSGTLTDGIKTMPFYFDRDNIEYTDQEGLVPVIFQDSIDIINRVKMGVEFDSGGNYFDVKWVEYSMNGTNYRI